MANRWRQWLEGIEQKLREWRERLDEALVPSPEMAPVPVDRRRKRR